MQYIIHENRLPYLFDVSKVFCKVTRYLHADSEIWKFIYTCILDKINYDLNILHEYQCIVNMWENEIVKKYVA